MEPRNPSGARAAGEPGTAGEAGGGGGRGLRGQAVAGGAAPGPLICQPTAARGHGSGQSWRQGNGLQVF